MTIIMVFMYIEVTLTPPRPKAQRHVRNESQTLKNKDVLLHAQTRVMSGLTAAQTADLHTLVVFVSVPVLPA